MTVKQWVKDMVDATMPSQMEVGKRLRHPDGRMVEVVDGVRWGEFGLSNFWEWREIREDGSLGKIERGYGW